MISVTEEFYSETTKDIHLTIEMIMYFAAEFDRTD